MARLSSKDYRDILDLVYLANRCEDLEGFINALFPSIIQVFHTECATFQLIKGGPHHIVVVQSRSFKSDGRNLYEDKYYPVLYKDSFYQYSPLLREAISSSKTVLKFGEAISLRDWERSFFYNNFMLPQHLYWELFLTLRWKNNLEGMITLWRPKRQPDYEDREVLKAARLASHLGVVVHNILLISQVNSRQSRILSADEAGDEGLLWLDSKFTPYFFNAKARDICVQLFSEAPYNTSNLERGEFPIPSCIIMDCSDLLSQLKTTRRSILPPKERVVSTGSGQKFRIECSLVWKEDQLGSAPNFMVTLSDLTDERKLETILQTRFQLSRRELDIIYYLLKGLSDNEIGEKLCISRQTVHTHIKNIYKKLGVKSRIELYRRVINSRNQGIPNHHLY